MGIRCYMLESRRKKPDGPRLNFSAEEAVEYQLDALKHNANLVKIMELRFMYRDLILTVGQFERFRRIFHHSTYRVLLGHKERKILSNLLVEENQFKQRVWVRGNRTEEEEIFQFTMVQVIKHQCN